MSSAEIFNEKKATEERNSTDDSAADSVVNSTSDDGSQEETIIVRTGHEDIIVTPVGVCKSALPRASLDRERQQPVVGVKNFVDKIRSSVSTMRIICFVVVIIVWFYAINHRSNDMTYDLHTTSLTVDYVKCLMTSQDESSDCGLDKILAILNSTAKTA